MFTSLGAPTRILCDFYVHKMSTLVVRFVNAVLSAAEAQATANSLLNQYGGTHVCVVSRGAVSGPPRAPIKSTPVDQPAGSTCWISAWISAGAPMTPGEFRGNVMLEVIPKGNIAPQLKPLLRSSPFSSSFFRPQRVAGPPLSHPPQAAYRREAEQSHSWPERPHSWRRHVQWVGDVPQDPVNSAFARAVLIAWANGKGAASSPLFDYGMNLEEAQPEWKLRDSVELRAFRDWWNGSGYKPAASTNTTGTGTDITYPTPQDLAALTAWAKEAGVALPAGVPWPAPPQETPPPGGGGPASCPANTVWDGTQCQPKPPPPPEPKPAAATSAKSSNTALWVVGGVAVLGAAAFLAFSGKKSSALLENEAQRRYRRYG